MKRLDYFVQMVQPMQKPQFSRLDYWLSGKQGNRESRFNEYGNSDGRTSIEFDSKYIENERLSPQLQKIYPQIYPQMSSVPLAVFCLTGILLRQYLRG